MTLLTALAPAVQVLTAAIACGSSVDGASAAVQVLTAANACGSSADCG